MRKVLLTVAAITASLIIVGLTNDVAGYNEPSGPMFEPTYPTAAPPAPAAQPTAKAEDDPGFDCRTQGNRVCGPGSGHPAGCYSGGVLVTPWTNYLNPKADPLYGQLESPC